MRFGEILSSCRVHYEPPLEEMGTVFADDPYIEIA